MKVKSEIQAIIDEAYAEGYAKGCKDATLKCSKWAVDSLTKHKKRIKG